MTKLIALITSIFVGISLVSLVVETSSKGQGNFYNNLSFIGIIICLLWDIYFLFKYAIPKKLFLIILILSACMVMIINQFRIKWLQLPFYSNFILVVYVIAFFYLIYHISKYIDDRRFYIENLFIPCTYIFLLSAGLFFMPKKMRYNLFNENRHLIYESGDEKDQYPYKNEDLNVETPYNPHTFKNPEAGKYRDTANYLRTEKIFYRAIYYYNKAIAKEWDNAVLYRERGDVKNYMGKSKEAIEDYNVSLSLDSSIVQTYCNRGSAYMRIKENENAIKDFTHCIKLDPSTELYYLNRGGAYLNLKRKNEACKEFEMIIKMNKNPRFMLFAQRRLDHYCK